jgi:YVTN family beta-propeller protein
MHRRFKLWMLLATWAFSGCGDAPADPPCAPAGPGRVVTADYLNQSITLFDRGRLVSGQCAPGEAMVGEAPFPLPEWEPGPLQVEVSADGRLAVVAVGPGFFTGGGQVLIGAPMPAPGGALLVLSLDPLEVLAEVPTAHVPMGIAIAPDGRRAYSANYGDENEPGTTLSIIDLEGFDNVADVEVGSRPEQVVLSPDGAVGLVNLTSGSVRAFLTDDVQGTLTAPLEVGTDPSDIAFVEGTPHAVVTNSMSFDLSVIDMSDPAAPEVVDTVDLPGSIPYGVTAVPGTPTVLVTTLSGTLQQVDVGTLPATVGEPLEPAGGAFPLTVAVEPDGRHAFVPHPIDRSLSILHLDTHEARAIQWLAASGPTYVAVD